MPLPKYGHTQNGLIACGGGSGSLEQKTCFKLSSGAWSTFTEDPIQPRTGHSSWTTPDGNILLIGGFPSSTTTELVHKNGTSISSFKFFSDDTYDNTYYACSIQLPEMFILTGGGYSSKQIKVRKYTIDGFQEHLPSLNERRSKHGCGYFHNNDMKLVFLVVGGEYNGGQASTETLVEGDQSWIFGSYIPTERWGISTVSLPNTVITTGGVDSASKNDVFIYDNELSYFKRTDSMSVVRDHHAASLVNMDDVAPFCKSWCS